MKTCYLDECGCPTNAPARLVQRLAESTVNPEKSPYSECTHGDELEVKK